MIKHANRHPTRDYYAFNTYVGSVLAILAFQCTET